MPGQATGRTRREWTVTVNGTGLRVEEVGAGAETIVFSPSLMTGRGMFEQPMAALAGEYRCISYDHRGQGDSGFGQAQPAKHLMGVEGVTDDALALLDQLGVDTCHWVGASLGGFVGVRLAARHPERIRSLVWIGPAMRPAGRIDRLMTETSGLVLRVSPRLGPVGSLVTGQLTALMMRGMFGGSFLADPARAADQDLWRQRFAAQLVPAGVPMLREVLAHPGNPPELLAQVTVPTLIVVGADEPDGGTQAHEVQRAIPGARLLRVPRAGHIVLVEQPDVGTAAIADFIRGTRAD